MLQVTANDTASLRLALEDARLGLGHSPARGAVCRADGRSFEAAEARGALEQQRVHQVDGTVEVGRVGGDGNFLDHMGRVSPDDSGAVYNAESQQYEAHVDHVLTATDRTE